ncbi:DUF3310 domain-containing protein [Mammaliicoccus sciuri]|uniref:DUF3310 domain-containing protein n=1 Tax=Mammaliicoccus sciuri TaxID=1296 RepID=UPI002DBE7509|nr:DUF3310 domain-containing protein [Mammaliicoccus sciuri]MEB8131530.1 DUF3310 domain-containing protein [Mammaliicoccus sciuri]
MEFKAGDRVHVTRLDGEKVDFYGTLVDIGGGLWELANCSDSKYEKEEVLKDDETGFGVNLDDFYTLATDEEDTEEPVIQRTTDIHDPVNKPSHYMLGDIEVKDIIAIVADKYHKGSVAHNVASALEYQMRAPEKNGLEDIKKARKCLDFAIENWE